MTRITDLSDDDITTSGPVASASGADDSSQDPGPSDTAADPDTPADPGTADDTGRDPGPTDTSADPDTSADR